MPDYSIFSPLDYHRMIDSLTARSKVNTSFSNIRQYFGTFADAGQHVNRIELFDFTHPYHPWNCEINDPADLFYSPHKTRINIIVNSQTRGPKITWLLKMLKEEAVYACAKVIALDSFLVEVLFGYNPEADEWVHLEIESDTFKGIERDLLVLHALKK